jgi:D-beta-D-heptose 7-phosphate kinase / D-beta-D-heptose 1-phosphate adenosyltransferase
MAAATFREPSHAALRELLRAMIGRRVVVVGDAMLDRYQEGRIGRISPEAPVPVFEIERSHAVLGGAANVAKCLIALGAEVELCAVVGDDADAAALLEAARSLRIGVGGVLVDPARPTTVKTRVVAGTHQVIRIDHERTAPLPAELAARMIADVEQRAGAADALILSDYAKGVLSEAICGAALRAAGRAPVLVDPKTPPWQRYRGATMIKPNAKETELYLGEGPDDDAHAERLGRQIGRQLEVRHVVITRAADGMTLVADAHRSDAAAALHLRARQHQLHDLTGSGDVVAAVLGLALAADLDVRDATWMSNVAAGVNVTRFGASAVSGGDILAAAGERQLQLERKILTREQAALLARGLREQGKTVVFTNGCFDILHLGHVTHLERSRQQGDALLVGVNTDASVTRLKGPGRPVQHEHDRSRIIAAQGCVDAVVLFDEDTPLELIEAIEPDVLTKGADYRATDVVGADLVERRGGRVVLIDLVDGRSTTGLIRRAVGMRPGG